MVFRWGESVHQDNWKKLDELTSDNQVPKSTLYGRLKDKSTCKQCGQNVITAHEGTMIVKGIRTFSEWGFPMIRSEIRVLVKTYLDRTIYLE